MCVNFIVIVQTNKDVCVKVNVNIAIVTMTGKIYLAVICSCLIITLPFAQTAGDSDNSDTPSLPGNDTHEVINKATQKATLKVTHLKVKVLLEDPFVMMKGHNEFEGMFIDLLKEITRRANLTYELSAQGDQMYGYEYAPGNWTGLVGSVQSGDAHVAVAPLTIVSQRQAVVDFTHPIMSSGLRILYKAPKSQTEEVAFGVLLSPFTPGLWILLLLMFIIISTLFYVIGRFSPYEDHAFVGKAATYEGLTMVNSLLYTFSSLTFQGYTAAPRSMSGRVLAAFWWIFVLLVIASYCASLCAIFLAYKPSINTIPFDSFEELAKQNSVAYGIVKGGSTQWYLSNSKRPVQSRLSNTIKAHGENLLMNSVREGMLRVIKSDGKFAFIMEGPMAEYLSGQPPCELMTLGEPLNEHAYGFACQKDTDICSNLNKAIMELQEEDYIFDLKEKWLHRGCNRGASEYVYQGLAFFDTFGAHPDFLSNRSVTLRRFSTGFLLLFVGIVLTALILVAEIFYAKRQGTAVPQRLPRGMEDQERIDREYRDEDA